MYLSDWGMFSSHEHIISIKLLVVIIASARMLASLKYAYRLALSLSNKIKIFYKSKKQLNFYKKYQIRIWQ